MVKACLLQGPVRRWRRIGGARTMAAAKSSHPRAARSGSDRVRPGALRAHLPIAGCSGGHVPPGVVGRMRGNGSAPARGPVAAHSHRDPAGSHVQQDACGGRVGADGGAARRLRRLIVGGAEELGRGRLRSVAQDVADRAAGTRCAGAVRAVQPDAAEQRISGLGRAVRENARQGGTAVHAQVGRYGWAASMPCASAAAAPAAADSSRLA